MRIRGISLITIGVLLGLVAGPAPASAAIFVFTEADEEGWEVRRDVAR